MADDMQRVIGLAVGLLIVVVIFYLAPGMGEEVSKALPVDPAGDFAGSPTGADVWTSGATMIKVVITIVFIGIAIGSLYKLRSRGE
jgi:hypothetical protein